MGIRRSLFMRSAVTEDRLHGNNRRLRLFRPRLLQGRIDRRRPVAFLNPENLPAISLKPSAHVFRKRQGRGPRQRNPVVVIKDDELTQSQMSCQRTGFRRHPFHDVAVTGQNIGKMIDHLTVRTVEAGGQMGLGDRHAHGIAQPLPERAGGHFHSRRTVKFGMPRRPAFPLAEGLQVIHGEVISGQMEQYVQKHGGMSRGKNEAVSIDPLRVRGIMFQMIDPEGVGCGSGAHRHSGMSRFRFFYGIRG
ncbi:MAG: hypothetical protein A4E74_02308 [Syntrophus sp. PtaB.Bin075]|nr:MAG: hypothetical protein A4E74_02308 [Syntrophus sp. PtaB.Bin075]